MLYAIVSRCGAGKDALSEQLKTFGMKTTRSYTTRPKRTASEDNHIFITKEDAMTIPDKTLETTYNGHQYFFRKSQLTGCDYIIVDPKGLLEIANQLPETNIHLVYIKANTDARRNGAISRATDKKEAATIFDERNKEEDAIFTELETALETNHGKGYLPFNINIIHTVSNDYKPETLTHVAEILNNARQINKNTTHVVQLAAKANLVEQHETGRIKLTFYDENEKDGTRIHWVKPEIFADYIMTDDAEFGAFIKNIFAKYDASGIK